MGMYGLLPVIVLLMMAVQSLVGVKLCFFFIGVEGGLLVRPQGPAGHKAHRPVDTFGFDSLTAAVAGTAGLGPDARWEL